MLKKWKIYNKFCNLKDFKTSLYFVQKKAFTLLKKEAQQDRYSVKNLLENSFGTKKFLKTNKNLVLLSSHSNFCFNIINNSKGSFYCIHCGMNIN